MRQVRREQRLAHAPDRPGFEHRADAFEDGGDVDAASARDLAERVAQKAGDPVFGDAQNLRVDGIVYRDGNSEHAHHTLTTLPKKPETLEPLWAWRRARRRRCAGEPVKRSGSA